MEELTVYEIRDKTFVDFYPKNKLVYITFGYFHINEFVKILRGKIRDSYPFYQYNFTSKGLEYSVGLCRYFISKKLLENIMIEFYLTK